MTKIPRLIFSGVLTTAILLSTSMTSLAFTDVGTRYSTAISTLQSDGVLQGYADGTFRPSSLINRAEFTKIIIAGKYSEWIIDGCLTNEQGMDFYDVPSNSWYSPYLCIATSGKLLSGYPDGTFKPAQNINFAEAAKILSGAFFDEYDVVSDAKYTKNGEPWYAGYIRWMAARNAIPQTIQGADYQITREDMAEMYWRLNYDKRDQPSYTYEEVESGVGKMYYDMMDLTPDTLPTTETSTPSENKFFELISFNEEVSISNSDVPGCGEPKQGKRMYSGDYAVEINTTSANLGRLYFAEGTSFDREIKIYDLNTLTNQRIYLGIIEQYDTCNGNILMPIIYYPASDGNSDFINISMFTDFDGSTLENYSAQQYGLVASDDTLFYTMSYNNATRLWTKNHWGIWDGVVFRMEKFQSSSDSGPWTSVEKKESAPFM